MLSYANPLRKPDSRHHLKPSVNRMKKIVLVLLCFSFLGTSGYAQKKRIFNFLRKTTPSCISTPYSPNFGTDTPSEEVGLWKIQNGANIPPGGSAPIGWKFDVVDNIVMPVFQNTKNTEYGQNQSLYSRPLCLDESKEYFVRFTFDGQNAGKVQNLKIYLTDNVTDETLYGSETFFVEEFSALPYGETSCSFILDSFPAPATAGKYRLVFKTINAPRLSTFYLKDISVDEMPAHQMDLISLNSPLSNCNLDNQTVSFKVRNNGKNCPENFNICYQVNTGEGTTFGAEVCQVFSDATLPYSTDSIFSFPIPANFTADVTQMKAWISYPEQTVSPDTLKGIQIIKTTSHTVPYACSFDDPAIYREWSVLPKSTMPSITWTMGGGKASIATNSVKSNDRLVSSCMALEKDEWYEISFTYSAKSTAFEKLRLYVGTDNTPSEEDLTLFDLQEFNRTEQRTVTAYFKPSETRSYFFGFLAYSDVSPNGGIVLQDISITKATPQNIPVYMDFENYENETGWQKINPYTNASGWEKSSGAGENFSGDAHLKSSSTSKTNVWLISAPLQMEGGKTYEILYNAKSVGGSQTLNIYAGNWNYINNTQTPNWSSTVSGTSSYQTEKKYFTPSETGVYFVAFQHKSESASSGLRLDNISIQDSVLARDTNISFVDMALSQDFSVCNYPTNEQLSIVIKNRSPYRIGWLQIYTETNGQVSGGIGSGGSIEPYQSRTISTNVYLANVGEYNVRAWISFNNDKNKQDDTSDIVNVQKIANIPTPHTMDFESNEPSIWTIRRSQSQENWWRFEQNNSALAHKGTGFAYLPPSGHLVSTSVQSIGTPCLDLEAGKPYHISFFYRAANVGGILSNTTLNVYAGTNTAPIEANLQKSEVVERPEYSCMTLYFTPQTSGTHYVFIEGVSTSLASGLCVDGFLIMDSVEAQRPDLSLVNFNIVRGENCEKSADTLSVEIKNNGFFNFQNPKVQVFFGGSAHPETLTGTIAPNKSVTFKLQTLFTHANWGADSVQLWLDVADNRSETRDTSDFVRSDKYAPQTPPYSVAFAPNETAGWNLLNAYEQPSTAFEYWTFRQNGQDTYAYFKNGSANEKPGLLASGCLSLDAEESYLITYSYKATDGNYPENLNVQYTSNDGSSETLDAQAGITNTDYVSKTLTLNPLGGNHERILFNSTYSANAKGLSINSFYIRVDTSAWDADVKIDNIFTPVSGIELTATETVSVNVSNIARRPLKNVPISYQLDNGTAVQEIIPTLNPGEIVSFTFAQKIDLSAYKEYTITVFTGLSDDMDRSNDTLSTTVTNTVSSVLGKIKEAIFTVYPNPATVEVSIESNREISTLYIYNLQGTLIAEKQINNTESVVNTSNLKPGLYLFTCQIGDQRISRRVVIRNRP